MNKQGRGAMTETDTEGQSSKELSANMQEVLRYILSGLDPFHGCDRQGMYGARKGTLAALQSRGFLDKSNRPTQAAKGLSLPIIEAVAVRRAMSPLQEEALSMISNFIATKGYSPTVNELASIAGVTQNAMFERLKGLRKKGWITNKPGSGRSFIPVAASEPEIPSATVVCAVVKLSAAMSDEQILSLIKDACALSNGLPFQVIPPSPN